MRWIPVILIVIIQETLDRRKRGLRQTSGEPRPHNGRSNVIDFNSAKQRLMEKRKAV